MESFILETHPSVINFVPLLAPSRRVCHLWRRFSCQALFSPYKNRIIYYNYLFVYVWRYMSWLSYECEGTAHRSQYSAFPILSQGLNSGTLVGWQASLSTETSYRLALLRNLTASVSALLFQIATHLLPFGLLLWASPFFFAPLEC